LIIQGRYEEALKVQDTAIRLEPRNPDAHSYRGTALLQLGRINEALVSYDQVIKLAPNAAVAHYNRANALQRLRQYEKALISIERALRIQPKYTDALTLCGMIYRALGDTNKALNQFDAALRINPQAHDAGYNKGFTELCEGDFLNGWTNYESRLKWDMSIRVIQSRSIDRVAPDWDGKPTSKPILVIPEQGLGDQIFFAGMLIDLQEVAPGSMVCLEPRLVPLFQRSFEQLSFSSPYEINTEQCIRYDLFSAQIHIGSLGKFFRSDADGLKRVSTPYLKADSVKTSHLRKTIASPNKIVCGISWRSKNADFGADKSITLEALQPILSCNGVEFVDLQYGDTAEEREHLAQTHGIRVQHLDKIDNKEDIDGLAALISACDIVITISNVTAHIAGALGKPTIVMLPNSPSLFWYWHRDRPDSPWYPTMTLIRQVHPKNWHDVINVTSFRLREFREQRSKC
jgi:hypothetical protein